MELRRRCFVAIAEERRFRPRRGAPMGGPPEPVDPAPAPSEPGVQLFAPVRWGRGTFCRLGPARRHAGARIIRYAEPLHGAVGGRCPQAPTQELARALDPVSQAML